MVRKALQAHGLAERIIKFPVFSATVAPAAEAPGSGRAHITKSLTFHGTENTLLLVVTGDARIGNGKFKARFGCKAKMPPKEVIASTGHAVGGVCPFALPSPAPMRTLRFFGGNYGHQSHRNQENPI